ncbi:hypothetical protein ACWIUD_08425 [Helicobacter sp. 23-1044]
MCGGCRISSLTQNLDLDSANFGFADLAQKLAKILRIAFFWTGG